MGGNERTDVLAGGDRAVNEPAQRVLFFGPIINNAQKAMQGATKALTAGAKAINEFVVDKARAAWNDLLPELSRRSLMQNVTIKGMGEHPYKPMRTFEGVNAWTNSSTEIYVGFPDPKVDEDVWWRTILYHEAVHVKQFAREGGPPDTYTKMMEHEVEAYGDTYEWLDEHPDKSPMRAATQSMEEARDFFKEELDSVKDSTSHIQDPQIRHDEQEKDYRRLLLGDKYSSEPGREPELGEEPLLPPHEDIKELYGL